MRRSEANHVYGNVAGIEIENTVTALVENNDVHDNTAGIMAFVLPQNPNKRADCTIRNQQDLPQQPQELCRPKTPLSPSSLTASVASASWVRTTPSSKERHR